MGEYEYAIAGWPIRSRELAGQVVGRHGAPHAIRSRALEWERSDEFRRMRVRDDGVLEQAVYYQIPEKRMSDLLAFDGRLVTDVSEQEVTAFGESEEINLLMLNLMHDVVIGRQTPQEAWQMYDKVLEGLKMHWPEPYTQELHFHTDESQIQV